MSGKRRRTVSRANACGVDGVLNGDWKPVKRAGRFSGGELGIFPARLFKNVRRNRHDRVKVRIYSFDPPQVCFDNFD